MTLKEFPALKAPPTTNATIVLEFLEKKYLPPGSSFPFHTSACSHAQACVCAEERVRLKSVVVSRRGKRQSLDDKPL